ncbi:hypothetical protein NNC19_01890 [Clostridium sp. SHJSY1]|uniref:hypothetical protein n=1 Tax=Clostridium sp. SHJSY1 TaxID=2942483 RepID=UPI002876F440|nr:hypothetical protein [Clostridium sp. SHJSY1]MDS0524410.1 hypothetical protein [Clostridium sp. SHJSY1]
MAIDIIRILYEKASKVENSQVKKPAVISAVSNNYKKKNEQTKKNFKKALVNAQKDIYEKPEHKEDVNEVIIDSSLTNLIYENSHLGTIVQEEIAKNPRLSNLLKDKSKINREPLDKI